MFTRIPNAAAALPGRVEPTSLLKMLAGEFALRVARVWPSPHTPFLVAPPARRHLVCLAFSLGREVAAHREVLLAGRLRRAIPVALGQAVAGLERALARMGEVAWASGDYRAVLGLLADPKAAKVLRHAESLDAEMVRRLAALPGPMADAAHLALALNGEGVALLGEAYAALRARDGLAEADAAAARWARAGTAKALFEAVRHDLAPEPLAPPHPGTARLAPLASKAALRDAARRFRNCLADCAPHAATGWSAYYEWAGPPGAVVEVTRDHVFGWRLEQARMAGNRPVPEPVREEILSDLSLMGIHVGRSGWELDRALCEDVGRAFNPRPLRLVVAEAFGAD